MPAIVVQTLFERLTYPLLPLPLHFPPASLPYFPGCTYAYLLLAKLTRQPGSFELKMSSILRWELWNERIESQIIDMCEKWHRLWPVLFSYMDNTISSKISLFISLHLLYHIICMACAFHTQINKEYIYAS